MQLQAIAVDAGIEGGKNQLRFLRDAAERILLDEQGSESEGLAVQNALNSSQETVGGVSVSTTDTPVRTIAKERLAKISGFSQDRTRLNQDLKLSRAMSQMQAVQYQTSRHLEHLLSHPLMNCMRWWIATARSLPQMRTPSPTAKAAGWKHCPIHCPTGTASQSSGSKLPRHRFCITFD